MITLTFGRKLPQDGDKGNLFFDALEANIQRDDSHTHDGLNSPKIPSSSSESVEQALAASWTDAGGGTFTQNVTMPTGLLFDKCSISFRVASGADTGCVFYPSVKRLTLNTYQISVNDTTFAIKAVYST